MIATSETSMLGTFAATLFALLNPLGMLPVFIGYTAGSSIGAQRWLALFVSMTVLGLMLLFLFAGTALLDFFGITLDAFRVAGGILLLLMIAVSAGTFACVLALPAHSLHDAHQIDAVE